jgi:hypothetical protein
MRIPVFLISLVLGGLLTILISLEAWTLNEIVNLKTTVATLSAKLEPTKQVASNEH